MNTSTSMRTILAAAAAGALVLGSAAGVMAKGKPETVPAPQKNDRLVSVSIKGHATIDLASLATAPDGTGLALRAKLWDPKKDSSATAISVTLGVYTKKVGGSLYKVGDPAVDAPPSASTPLVLDVADVARKVKDYRGTAALKGAAAVWTSDQVAALAAALDPGEKAYICIAGVEITPSDTKLSMQVKKRLGVAKGKAVRDCVKVIDSTPLQPAAPVPAA